MKTILLLHGAIGSAEQLQPLAKALSNTYIVHTFNFSGHGGNPIDGTFSIEKFAGEVVDFLAENNLAKVSIFGYSMGGYVALYVAKHYPEKVDSIITLATKFQWDKDIAAKEIKMLQPTIIEEKLPAFAKQLHDRHQPTSWKTILEQTAQMMIEMGNNNPLQAVDFTALTCKVLLMIGDRDKMVSLAETIDTYKLLPKAQLAVLPNTTHPIEQVDIQHIVFLATKFWGDEDM